MEWGTRSSGVGFFCFVSPRAWKKKKPNPLDRGPPLHVNRPLIEQQKKHAGCLKKTCPQIRCIPPGRWWLAQCKSTCEENAGSDISFENITLCLDQLKLKIQFTKEKRTLKTLVLSREANTLPQCKSSCKEQAGSDKNLSVKPYSLISCCFKRNL